MRIVERVRQHLRNAPDAALTLEQAGEDAGISPVRLHQVFFEIHGENFGEYVRRVRLEYACGLMRAFPDWTCTRVALEAGYSESSDFSRSFRRWFGLPPSRWDRVAPLNRLSPTLKNRQDLKSDSADIPCIGFPDTPSVDGMPVELSEEPEKRIAAMLVRDAIEPGRLRQAFDDFEDWLRQNDQLRDTRRFMGLSYDSNLDTPADQIRFELAYPVDDAVAAEERILIRTIPGRRVAKLHCRGGPAEFVAAWDHLLRVFLPNSRWRFGPGPQLEVYYNDPRRHEMLYWDMDCVVPIQAK